MHACTFCTCTALRAGILRIFYNHIHVHFFFRHPTSSSSAAEIVSVLFFNIMHYSGNYTKGTAIAPYYVYTMLCVGSSVDYIPGRLLVYHHLLYCYTCIMLLWLIKLVRSPHCNISCPCSSVLLPASCLRIVISDFYFLFQLRCQDMHPVTDLSCPRQELQTHTHTHTGSIIYLPTSQHI